MKKINKVQFNLIIDIIMFAVMMAVAGIGFLMKYILLPGFARNEVYGSNVELYFWGFDRHEWGSIHLILSYILLLLLLLHLVFHWKQIVTIYKRLIPLRSVRIVGSLLFLVLSVVLAVVPLFVHPQVVEGVGHSEAAHRNRTEAVPAGHQSYQEQQAVDSKEVVIAETNPSEHHDTDILVNGQMSLHEVAADNGIDESELCRFTGVPPQYAEQHIGRLRKQFNFDMNDLREFVAKHAQ